ncbi:MAG: ABC transporter ATP-binding protein [Oscillospiraceae bacterium]|nr:ABC transporter ATP-binding protein [Oscillospiraceae bacterium]
MITVSHLTKYYGEHLAVDDLSFEIDEGQVYGFLGPNGAGKSTTMNIMTGCLSATEGTVAIDGYDIFEQPGPAKKRIGYLPEQPPLYMNESPSDYLRFVGAAKGLHGEALQTQIEEVVRQTGIEPVRHRRIGALSKGYKQRVGIAQALLGNPKVIILDEPTVGLDPIQIIEIRELIRELGKTHTVIFSSHILSEVQTICDQILMIAHGKLVAFDAPDNLEKRLLSKGEIDITADVGAAELEVLLSGIDGLAEVSVQQASAGYSSAHIRTEQEDIYAVSGAIFHACADQAVTLVEMSLKKASLEDVFLELAAVPEDAETESSGEDIPKSGEDAV